jgi:UDP-N-acetylmuramyl pentapeptide phosphotransferase/UDP-N-acetylglucosamine-1-phosphate transferase
VQSLPFLVSLGVAAAIVPAAVRGLRRQGFVRANYRGAQVAFPAGIALVAAALVALVPLALVDELTSADVFRPDSGTVVLYVVGVAVLGLLDDLVGSGALGSPAPPQPDAAPPPRGWRGHARATLTGGFSTGTLKAAGSLGLALFVLRGRGLDSGEYLLAVALVVLVTNLFNLLDLRPGRSAKALILLGAGLTIGSRNVHPLWTLGLFLGPALVLLPFDLRERAMLGDTGSNVLGAVAGLWLVLALSTLGQAIALGVVAAMTVYGEFRSLSELIERTPLLRQLDSLGRATHA